LFFNLDFIDILLNSSFEHLIRSALDVSYGVFL
jgi:hypothetical protein